MSFRRHQLKSTSQWARRTGQLSHPQHLHVLNTSCGRPSVADKFLEARQLCRQMLKYSRQKLTENIGSTWKSTHAAFQKAKSNAASTYTTSLGSSHLQHCVQLFRGAHTECFREVIQGLRSIRGACVLRPLTVLLPMVFHCSSLFKQSRRATSALRPSME